MLYHDVFMHILKKLKTKKILFNFLINLQFILVLFMMFGKIFQITKGIYALLQRIDTPVFSRFAFQEERR